ncbi:MAG: BrnT family toxin [Rhizonema sp. PD37]|nr:BrnT family toxin [Rhizonema sp. PD37]
MKIIRWDLKKNEKLRSERGVSFEAVLAALETGNLLDDYIHPNQGKYPNQRLLVVQIEGYAYLIPYVETESELFLKTIIPSRKATKQYLL